MFDATGEIRVRPHRILDPETARVGVVSSCPTDRSLEPPFAVSGESKLLQLHVAPKFDVPYLRFHCRLLGWQVPFRYFGPSCDMDLIGLCPLTGFGLPWCAPHLVEHINVTL